MNRHQRPSAPRAKGQREKRLRYLIVCEGRRSEPNYFRTLSSEIKSDIVAVELEGDAGCTLRVVERAESLVRKRKQEGQAPYNRVWVVFDYDGREDFKKAIERARSRSNGFGCAWSNESFELWYLLHFQDLESAITRQQYCDKLETWVRKKRGNPDFKYQKEDESIYQILKEHGSEADAIRRAEKLRKLHPAKEGNYNEWNPCTCVDLLVQELRNPSIVLRAIEHPGK
jgi:hypothetical protein